MLNHGGRTPFLRGLEDRSPEVVNHKNSDRIRQFKRNEDFEHASGRWENGEVGVVDRKCADKNNRVFLFLFARERGHVASGGWGIGRGAIIGKPKNKRGKKPAKSGIHAK